MRRLRGRPGIHDGGCGHVRNKSVRVPDDEDVRCVIKGLVPLLMLPRVLGWVQTTSYTVSFCLFFLMLLLLLPPPRGTSCPPLFSPPMSSLGAGLLTLLRQGSWHRHRVHRDASTRQSSRRRRWWHRRGGRCSSMRSQLPRQRPMSRRSAVMIQSVSQIFNCSRKMLGHE